MRRADVGAQVGQAIDAGVNFFDTADIYARGQSEEVLGQALRLRRDAVVIATKGMAGLERRWSRPG